MIIYTPLELAIEKAKKENNILFYHDYGNNYDIESLYDYFVFHEFTTIEFFCEELYDYCCEKSDNEMNDYDFPDHLNNDDFMIVIDFWKNINVTNFPENINISEYGDMIINFFKNKK